jgi:hypothetical protein
MNDEINVLDVVALTGDRPDHNLHRGEIGTIVECHPDATYDVEFVAQDGNTYALVTLPAVELIALREKPIHDSPKVVPVSA